MTTFTSIESLAVAPNRQRREFEPGSLNELADSISTVGLMHAPVVRQGLDGLILVAGERRLRAISDLHDLGVLFKYQGEIVPAGQVPYVTLGQLSQLEAWEAELEENIRRVDLTWQERAQATASLMELRQAQADDAGLPAPTVSDIAREVRTIPDAFGGKEGPVQGDYQSDTRKELIVSRFLHDKDVAAAPTLKEAYKVLKKKEEGAKNAQLAATVGRNYSVSQHALVQGDCLHWMREQEAGQFDVILADPPYGMGADSFGDSGQGSSAGAHFYQDDYPSWAGLMQQLPAALFRITKPDAHAYLFCDFDRFPELRERMGEAGWRVHRTPLIWHNPDGFRCPWPDQGPQRKYELILYAVKGRKKVTSIREDVLRYGRDAALGHPAQKPVPLLIDLLRRSAAPGDRVLDPFAGSGSTIEAAHELKLTCTAVEKDPSAYGIAVKRLQSLSAFEPGLF
jgi:site-specific DNA-methyltransferase (adenine-specific)